MDEAKKQEAGMYESRLTKEAAIPRQGRYKTSVTLYCLYPPSHTLPEHYTPFRSSCRQTPTSRALPSPTTILVSGLKPLIAMMCRPGSNSRMPAR